MTSTAEYDAIQEAADAIRERTGYERHDAVFVLGSGLGSYAERFPDAAHIGYGELPGFVTPYATGHAGYAASVTVGDKRILLYSGRTHAYDGYDLADVVRPVRAAIAAGASTVVLSNACGGIRDGLRPGDLTVVADHLNIVGRDPMQGPNDERLGPRYTNLTDAYDSELRALAVEVAAEQEATMDEVVYAWWHGPSFETPAEIRMIRTLGGDVVGMSTVPEALAARHMGARVVAFSLVTNHAAGLSGNPLSAEEVFETAAAARPRVERFFDAFLPRL